METRYRLLDHLVSSLAIVGIQHAKDMTVSVLSIIIKPALYITSLAQEFSSLLVARARICREEHIVRVCNVIFVP